MVMLGCELFKRTESNTSNNQEFLFAIKHKSMSRDFRLCMTCPFHVCFRNIYGSKFKLFLATRWDNFIFLGA